MTILVTGGRGLVGSALQHTWKKYSQVRYVGTREADLVFYKDVQDLFEKVNPSVVIHLAADVGGISYNMKNNADILTTNLLINTHVLDVSACHGVDKIISLLSTCVYPDNPPAYPLKEEYLHAGEPHYSNFGYAYSKRILEIQSRAYYQDHSLPYCCLIPTNIYGPNDNFHTRGSHFVPAAIRKIYEAHIKGVNEVEFWGDGSQLRQFTYSLDVARVINWFYERDEHACLVNIGNEDEVRISDIIDIIVGYFGYSGNITFNRNNKLAGQYRKPASMEKLRRLGCDIKFTDVETGIINTCKWFEENYPDVRGIDSKWK